MKEFEKSNKIDVPCLIKSNWWFRFIHNDDNLMTRPDNSIFPQPYVFWDFKRSNSITNILLPEEEEDGVMTGQPYFILNKFYQLGLPVEKRGVINNITAYFYLRAGYIQVFLNDGSPGPYPILKPLLCPQEPNDRLPTYQFIETIIPSEKIKKNNKLKK